MSASGRPPPGPGDEAVTLARLRAGDPGAFEVFVRAHAGRMRAVARRVVENDEDARDVVQEAFLSAFRALPTFEGGAQLGTWLHRITVNAALMKLRQRRRRPEEPIEDLLPQFLADGHHRHHPGEWDPVEALLARREVRDLVRAAIARLPVDYRTVLVLRDIEELDTAETARLLGVTPAAVKTRLHRARQALRALLAGRLEARPR